jgi:hypothetical protein
MVEAFNDGKQHIATGCLKHQAREAEERLAAYIADKYRPSRRPPNRRPLQVSVPTHYDRPLRIQISSGNPVGSTVGLSSASKIPPSIRGFTPPVTIAWSEGQSWVT